MPLADTGAREKSFLWRTYEPRSEAVCRPANVLTDDTASKGVSPAAGSAAPNLRNLTGGHSGGLHTHPPHCLPKVPVQKDQEQCLFLSCTFARFSQILMNIKLLQMLGAWDASLL